jgi:hypothetical protein
VGPKDYGYRLVEVGRSFPGILLSSQALRWRVPGMVLSIIVPGGALLGY